MPDPIEVVGEVTEPQADSQLADPVQKEPEQHEPPKDSKRWNEIYHEAKEGKRTIESMKVEMDAYKEDLEAIKKHNKALSEAMVSVEDKYSEANKPDPIEDPEKYESWMMEKIKRDLRNENRNTPAEATHPVNPQTNQRLYAQEQAMWADHADYYDVAGKVMQEMKINPALNMRIRGSDNPAKELYTYHQEKQGIRKTQTIENNEKGFVETGGPPGGPPVTKNDLTEQQKRVANRLGISEENYSKQLKAIGSSQEVI